ncbi:thioredoxin [Candidatus Woesearchaeota archaeon]|nr:thioredoxin [Candidatus Woesearchaeota archaeon]
MVNEISPDEFEQEVINAEMPVIVDFWASWCGPCKMLAPIFNELSKEYEGKLKFCKISTEDHPDMADRFEIRGIPCLIVFKNGKELERISGYSPKETLRQKIDEALSKI